MEYAETLGNNATWGGDTDKGLKTATRSDRPSPKEVYVWNSLKDDPSKK